MTAINVGERLKELRKRNGISQRELSRRAGVPNSAISVIENNKVSPSVDSLTRVLNGFPMTIIEFFSDNKSVEEKFYYKKDELIKMSDGSMSFSMVGADRKDRKIRFLYEHYPAGGDTGENLISHNGEEVGIVVRGRMEITIGDRVQLLETGDSFYIDTRIPHRFRNIDQEECEVVTAATPPNF
jgi:transcriptional regulator with XRE-family HTH domain|tara:strand:+ start:4830 stop:5381 length:552 start_codon:yes stop_codon:yes gene_type:complete